MHEPEQGFWPVAGQRDSAVSGFQPHDATIVCRLAYRPANVATDTQRRHTRRHCRRLATARATWRTALFPWVFCSPIYQIVGLPPQGELRHVRFGDEDTAGVLEPLDHGGVCDRHMILKQLGAPSGHDTLGVDAIFDRKRNAVHRAPVFSAADCVFCLPSSLHHPVWKSNDGVQFRVNRLNTVQMALDHLHWGERPVSDALGQFDGVGVDYILRH